MHKHWDKIIFPLIKKIKPKHIVEVGAGKGYNTENILKYCKENNAKLTSIDPKPNFDVDKLKNEFSDEVEFYYDLSLRILPFLDKFDIILIDGDHNWYTVYNELKMIENIYNNTNNYPLIILHDICWPYGRRDLYYNPDTIPKEYLLPYDQLGMVPNQKELSKNVGLNYKGFNNALYEGGAKNGVLTAVEDYIDDSPLELLFYSIPAYHGLGILFLKNQDLENIVESIIDYPSIMEDLEKHYLKIITCDMRLKNNKLNQKINIKNKELVKINGEKAVLQKKNGEKDEVIKSLNGEKAVLQKKNGEKDGVIKSLNGEKAVLQKKNGEKEGVIKSLNGEKAVLQKKNGEKDGVIKSLKKKIIKINKEKDNEINKLTEEKNNEINKIVIDNQKILKSINSNLDKFNVLSEENNFIKMAIGEKDTQIKSLEEEIEILNSIIREKDKTIDSINNH